VPGHQRPHGAAKDQQLRIHDHPPGRGCKKEHSQYPALCRRCASSFEWWDGFLSALLTQRRLDAQGIRRFKASTRQLSAHTYAPAQGIVVTQYARDRYSIKAAGEYRAVALEMFADWRVIIGRHPPLAVAARIPRN